MTEKDGSAVPGVRPSDGSRQDKDPAQQEYQAFGTKDFEAAAKSRIRTAIHGAALWLLRLAALVFSIMFLTWALHIIVPSWGWLCADELDRLQNFLFSATIAALVSEYARKSF